MCVFKRIRKTSNLELDIFVLFFLKKKDIEWKFADDLLSDRLTLVNTASRFQNTISGGEGMGNFCMACVKTLH